MFNLKNTKTLSKRLYKSGFCRYFPSNLITINNNNSKNEKNIPREHSYIPAQNSYNCLQFNITHIVAAITQYTNGPAISSKKLDPVALFKRAKLTLSFNIHLEKLEKSSCTFFNAKTFIFLRRNT